MYDAQPDLHHNKKERATVMRAFRKASVTAHHAEEVHPAKYAYRKIGTHPLPYDVGA